MSTDWFELSNLKVTAYSIVTVDEVHFAATKVTRDSEQLIPDRRLTTALAPSGIAVPKSRDHGPPGRAPARQRDL
ncbi:hypothetical protein ABZ829_35905 [Streptomyces xanthochromogenes]|uniref:hypothetical protein n=1 Tax=Streptomyces xanthochromogenes TaxID=67384 RepID=UPI00341EF3AA